MESYIDPRQQEASEPKAAREPELTEGQVEAIATVCYEANVAYCKALALEPPLPLDVMRASIEEGVRLALRDRGFRDAEQSHDRWMERKLREGWRYGERKSLAEKTHPCLLPYGALSRAEQRKDKLFVAICAALDPRR